jgi:hypothetical protein
MRYIYILYHKYFKPPNSFEHILILSIKLVEEILKSYHESPINGHTGISLTLHKLQNAYYWTI